MTNRLEFLSSVFGAALAGGVAVPFSTFSTATEFDEVLRLSGCSVLLFERTVLKKDFAAMLAGLEPQGLSRLPARCDRTASRFCARWRRLASINDWV